MYVVGEWVEGNVGNLSFCDCDIKFQTGGEISMGLCVLHSRSGKQEPNVNSSTKSELVGNRNYLPYNIRILLFITAQGYPVKDNIMYQ